MKRRNRERLRGTSDSVSLGLRAFATFIAFAAPGCPKTCTDIYMMHNVFGDKIYYIANRWLSGVIHAKVGERQFFSRGSSLKELYANRYHSVPKRKDGLCIDTVVCPNGRFILRSGQGSEPETDF